MASTRMHETFEDWSDLKDWAPAGFPTGDGMWMWQEPGAQVATRDGWLELRVPEFTRSHDEVQIFDNPKHLLACARNIPVPETGLVVEVEMAAQLVNGDASAWGNGFASFNLMDFQNGLVLDGLANGERTAILFERLHLPGVIPKEQSFTVIADGPASSPGQIHCFRFEIDPVAGTLCGSIDGTAVFQWRGIPAKIAHFTPGFGLITLLPIDNGKSVSLKGQGATGRLGKVRVSRLRA